jgi:eukaryotic-like serine/threonine-protein kinase
MIELLVQRGGQVLARHPLAPGVELLVGSDPGAGCRLEDPLVSPRHLRVVLRPQGGVEVQDLDSDTGTTSASRPLPPGQPVVLDVDDTLEVGEHVLVLQGPPRAVGPQTRRMLDDYEPLRELGKGAAGTVFLARHRVSGREVAVKLLHAEVGTNPVERERFVREAAVGRRIQSPHVVAIYEARVDGPRAFLAMELLRGRSLRDRILAGPVPIPEALRIGLGVARGLQAAHAAGVVHRDVKPGNVMLGDDGSVKVADFGLAKDAAALQALTRTREGMGTLAYIAPEQLSDAKRVDGRADLYSLGATLFHTVAGRPPFTTPGSEIIQEIFDAPPPPLAGLRPDCPPGLARLVAWLLEKDPDDRPPDAGLVAAELLKLC